MQRKADRCKHTVTWVAVHSSARSVGPGGSEGYARGMRGGIRGFRGLRVGCEGSHAWLRARPRLVRSADELRRSMSSGDELSR